MTSRQWRLYDFIKQETIKGNTLTQKDICDNISEYVYNERPNDKCPMIWSDVDFINHSLEVEKIIVVDKFTYRIGTRDEAKAYAEKLLIGAVKKFKRYWSVENKIRKDGQGKLISNQDKPIDNTSKARDFVEAFLRDIDFENDSEIVKEEIKENHEQLNLFGVGIIK